MHALFSSILAISVLCFFIGILICQLKIFSNRTFRLFTYILFAITFLLLSFLIVYSHNLFDAEEAGNIAGSWFIWYYVGSRFSKVEKLRKYQSIKTAYGVLTIISAIIVLSSKSMDSDFYKFYAITHLIFGIALVIPPQFKEKEMIKKKSLSTVFKKISSKSFLPKIQLSNPFKGVFKAYQSFKSDLRLNIELKRKRKELELRKLQSEIDYLGDSDSINNP